MKGRELCKSFIESFFAFLLVGLVAAKCSPYLWPKLVFFEVWNPSKDCEASINLTILEAALQFFPIFYFDFFHRC